MFRNHIFSSIAGGFFFSKVLPGLLIGLFAINFDLGGGRDILTFVASMVAFWAAIGIGHGVTALATSRAGR